MRHWHRGALCGLLAVVLTFTLGVGRLPAWAEAGDDLPPAQERSQTVRVYLSRLRLTDRMDLTLASSYGLTLAGGEAMRFPAGSEIAILLMDNALYLYYQGMSMDLGRSTRLTRYEDGGQGETGFRLTNYPALYQGDLSLDIVEGRIRPILSLHVEDYLLGVVPYEMSESFPLEALKAQAVAARTYALRKQSPRKEYDLVDTTNDQVYKGYVPGNAQVERAVAETRGVCGFYKGALAQCYYAASNGGQTELVETVWATDSDYSYYAFGEDPYDVENPASVVRRLAMQKQYSGEEAAPYALRRLLADELTGELLARGYDPAAASVRVDEVTDTHVASPVREGSKLMTMLHLTVKISGRTRTETTPPPVDTDTEDVSLFAVQEATQTPAPTATPVPTPVPTPEVVYGEFTPIEEPFTLAIPIFPTAERALSMDISANYDNEIWSILETKEKFIIEVRRYGHGVGMSQRGAQWMAVRYGKTYREILAFYYPGLTLMRYPEEPTVLPPTEEALSITPGPAPTPTPRPTLMPATQQAERGQWYATVTGIDDDSSLNLRAAPDLSSEVLMRLYKHQRLLVLERCEEEGWVKVRTDTAVGYVVESFLTREGK